MTIGYVLDDTLDSTDGVQQYVIALGSWFSKQGHDVHYLVGETSREDIENVHSLARNMKVSFNKNKLTIPLRSDAREIRKILDKYKFDVLHVQTPYSPLFSSKVINQAYGSSAIVGTFHILPFAYREKVATKALSQIVRMTNKKFGRFISVSEPAKLFARKWFGVDSVVIPNPVVIPELKSTNRETGVTNIVFLGRLVLRKGILQLLLAIKQLTADLPDNHIKLTVYGTGPLLDDVKNKIEELGIQEIVTLAGFLDENKKSEALSKADVAVFPSLGGESFGIVLTEAMAAGAGVVIGGDNPGYRSVLGYDETLFNPENTQEFVDCMKELVTKPELRTNIHSKQQILVKNYDINIVAPQVSSVYGREIAKLKRNTHNI